MPKWEYRVDVLEFCTWKEEEKFLNDYGAKGWELVTVAEQSSTWRYRFKRPVQPEPKKTSEAN